MTVVIVEHEIEVIASYADRIVVMADGEIAMVGAPHEIFRQVEALDAVGVRTPQITQLAYQLEKRDRPLPEYPVTLDEGLELIQGWE